MPSFTLTKLAMDDLREIGRYTQQHWGREQRNVYLRMLDGAFHQLAANPHKGKTCDEIRNGYRKFTAGSHIVFYRQKSVEAIEIVRILHGRMDIEARLSSPQ
jgi:toxin ParE1/3/4